MTKTPWGTHYRLKAYPYDMRDQFRFVSDLTVRGREAIAAAGGRHVAVPYAPDGRDGPGGGRRAGRRTGLNAAAESGH